MDTTEFAKEKRDEILALAARHNASEIRIVIPETTSIDTVSAAFQDSLKIVASFTGDGQTSQYFDALVAFQTDLEMWLGIAVHVYDSTGFKGADGEEFLRKTQVL